jgi:hypothetical protein
VSTDFSESDAQRIADRGRDALIERLRPAFYETARQHSDILQLDDEQIEQMILRAADRADGLQWRRALAAIAADELGLSLGEALSSPVVARAQEIVGAPSYEDALTALGLGQPGTAGARPGPPAPHADSAAPEDDDAGPEITGAEPEIEPDAPRSDEPDPFAPDEADEEDEDEDEDEPPADGAAPDPLRLPATHLGGIATLEVGEQDLELRIGSNGLDIARKPGRVLGRLRWREIRTLEVQAPRGLRRRRRGERAQLVIRTQHGDASFEVPGVGEEALQEQLAPLVAHYAQS